MFSGRHAKLSLHDDDDSPALYVEDLESANGTYVENTRLDPGKPYKVELSKRIIIGSFLISTGMKSQDLNEGEDDPSDSDDKQQASDRHLESAEETPVDDEEATLVDEEEERIVKDEEETIAQDDKETLVEGGKGQEFLTLERIEELVEDPSVTQIVINNARGLMIERGGIWLNECIGFASEQHLAEAISVLTADASWKDGLTAAGQEDGVVKVVRKDGFCLSAVDAPRSLRSAISIKKPAREYHNLQKLLENGVLSSELADMLVGELCRGANIIICGPADSGKTSLLAALADEIKTDRRCVLIQDSSEISLSEIVDEIPASGSLGEDLSVAGLLNPERIIVNEFSLASAPALLSAVLAGSQPILASCRARNITALLGLLELECGKSQKVSPGKILPKCIASALDFIVQMGVCGDRERRVVRVSRLSVELSESGEFLLDDCDNILGGG